MSLFPRKFRRYFTDTVDHAHRALCLEDFEPKSILASFVRDLRETRSTLVANPDLSREDILEELLVIWLQLRDRWLSDERLQDKPLGDYVAGFSPWMLRDRIRKLVKPHKKLSKGPVEERVEPPSASLNDDVRFLVFGSTEWPFSELGGYERNLLYLKTLKEMSIYQIARLLQKDRVILKRTIDLIEERIRRLKTDEDSQPNTNVERDVGQGAERTH